MTATGVRRPKPACPAQVAYISFTLFYLSIKENDIGLLTIMPFLSLTETWVSVDV